MAITDKNFTGQELAEALKETPSLMDIIKGVLKVEKVTVRSEAEETAFVTNLETTTISKKTKEHAEALEKDVKELTGIEKKDDQEKYYDYFKRAVTEKLGSVKKIEDELELLKKSHTPSEADKKRITQLEDELTKLKTETTTKLQAKEKEVLDLKVGGEIEVAMAKVRATYKQDIPADIIKVVEDNLRAELIANAKYQDDGVLTIIGSDKNVILDPATYKPQNVENIITERLKSVIDEGKKQTGAGSGEGTQGKNQQAQGASGKAFTRLTATPASAKTKVQLSTHMLTLGYLQDSKEYQEDYDKFAATLPLR